MVEDSDLIKLFRLSNVNGMQVGITNYGAIITSILAPDREGNFADVALGFDDVSHYINATGNAYFGAVVGRYGNRIAQGKFSIDGRQYQLTVNNGSNSLHGGAIGFDRVVWDTVPLAGDGETGLKLSYLAKDGEEGYPGNLAVTITYRLTDANEIVVEYFATADQPTPVNLTQHSYFNLKGEGEGNILDHELIIHAEHCTPIDADFLPTGEIAPVEGTPLDFRQAKPIGRDIDNEHEQLKFGLGYDHNWVLKGKQNGELKIAAEVYEPASGRVLTVSTREPGIQFYCGNFLDGRLIGKSGKAYPHRSGFCLETQHFPDSPNRPEFPSTILRPGEKYETQTVFRFSTR